MKKIKIGVTGAHSTGKTTFLGLAEQALRDAGLDLSVGKVPSFGKDAHKLGLPILKEHTGTSTLWFIGKTICAEIEQSRHHQIVLVDRPVLDAVGYLQAALKCRKCTDPLSTEIERLSRAYSQTYDILFLTEIDASIPLGDGRDSDVDFRALVGAEITKIASGMQNCFPLRSCNTDEALQYLLEVVRRA
jgi:hypothetical protein